MSASYLWFCFSLHIEVEPQRPEMPSLICVTKCRYVALTLLPHPVSRLRSAKIRGKSSMKTHISRQLHPNPCSIHGAYRRMSPARSDSVLDGNQVEVLRRGLSSRARFLNMVCCLSAAVQDVTTTVKRANMILCGGNSFGLCFLDIPRVLAENEKHRKYAEDQSEKKPEPWIPTTVLSPQCTNSSE